MLVISVLVLVLFITPARWWVLYTVMGLSTEMAEYIVMPLALSFLVAVFWGYSSLLRGLLTALRRTGELAYTAALRLAVVIAVGSLTLIMPDINGALVGVLAFAGASAAECAALGWKLFAGGRSKLLFPARADAD